MSACCLQTSSDHVPVYESAFEKEQKTFLGMLEENSTPLDKAAGALYFRCLFGRELPRNELHPAQYPRLSIELKYSYKQTYMACIHEYDQISALLRIVENDMISNETRANAAWALGNVAEYSEKATHIIVKQKGIEALRNGLIFGTEDFPSRCISALYNIAACCADCKRKCRQAGLITTIAHILPERCQAENMELKCLFECALELIHGGFRDGTVPILTIMLLTTSSAELVKHYTEWTDIASYCLEMLAFIAEDTQTGTRTDIVLSEPGLLDLVFEILDSVSVMIFLRLF
uniref:Importin subunit alpha-1-like n=1 Tax=Angiostrongylus cantonensis TaxID=6313 RepID=A0A0K0D2H5_ANGCA